VCVCVYIYIYIYIYIYTHTHKCTQVILDGDLWILKAEE
jgi:hypothetical protein